MWYWLEQFLELINRYGFPIVTSALFLIAVLMALRGLWREYRRLSDRYEKLLMETSRLIELNAAEYELAQQTIAVAIQRISDIREILRDLTDIINLNDTN